MIIGITGIAYDKNDNRLTAGSGKDTAAARLVEKHNFVAVALADPMKRLCMEVFNFTEEQLWGGSDKRNEPDKRYVRSVLNADDPEWGDDVWVCGECAPKLYGVDYQAATLQEWREDYGESEGALPSSCFSCGVPLRLEHPFPEFYSGFENKRYLTPRHALQQLGTEWGRSCYLDLWVDYALRVATQLLERELKYDQVKGLMKHSHGSFRDLGSHWGVPLAAGVVVPDLRFHNEAKKIRDAGGQIWRVKRPVDELPQMDIKHGSEVELSGMPDSVFDRVLENTKDVHHLHMLVDAVMARESGRIIEYDEKQRDVPPYKR